MSGSTRVRCHPIAILIAFLSACTSPSAESRHEDIRSISIVAPDGTKVSSKDYYAVEGDSDRLIAFIDAAQICPFEILERDDCMRSHGFDRQTPEPEQFTQARDASRENLTTREGRQYDKVFGRKGDQRLKSAFSSCMLSLRVTWTPTSFVLLYRIDANGSPAEELLHPATSLGICVQERMHGFVLPAPPSPDYWTEIDMAIDQ